MTQFIDSVWSTFAAGIDATQPRWTVSARQFFPLLAAFLLGFLSLTVLNESWRRWDNAEVKIYLDRGDYALAPLGLLCIFVAPFALAFSAVYAASGSNGLLVLLVIAVAIVSAGSLWKKKLQVPAQRGEKKNLQEKEKVHLLNQLEEAENKGDWETITSAALAFSAFDAKRAQEALKKAVGPQNIQAAWELGKLHTKEEEWEKAADAFKQGAELGDMWSARVAAGIFDELNNKKEADMLWDRAYELGDSMAAFKKGTRARFFEIKDEMTEEGKEKKLEEARSYYMRGVERRDSYSARLLATDFKNRAKRAKGDEAAKLNRSVEDYYRLAFEWGLVGIAGEFGDFLRQLGNLPQARRAYVKGARLRDAEAALKLGKFELEEEHNEEAARRAFQRAIQLDS